MSTVRIQIRRGTSTEWTSVNPVLAGGEAGFESDTKKIKIGDGTSSWTALGYATVTPAQLQSAIEGVVAGEIASYATLTELSDAISQEVTDRNAAILAAIETVGGADFIGISEKGANNGVAELDNAGKVPDSQINSSIARQSDLSGAISTEVTNRNSAIATAKSEAISTAESYADTKKSEAISTAESYADTKKSEAISAAESYADGKFAPLASPTFTGAVTLARGPMSDLEAATKKYVDNIAVGIKFLSEAKAATTGNFASVYANGTAGVGATLTASANGVLLIDGYSPVVNDRIIVKGQTDDKQNGVYTVTNVGSSSSKAVLTRSADFDNSLEPVQYGAFLFVMNGTVNGGYGYIFTPANDTVTFGTTSITFTAFNAAKTMTAGYGMLLNGTAFDVDTDYIATKNNPTFTGTAVLPSTTSIGNVSATEIGYVDGVTSSIQNQIDSKLAISTANSDWLKKTDAATTYLSITDAASTYLLPADAASTYETKTDVASVYETKSHATSTFAPKADATFTGNITLPSTTQIGSTNGDEIGYLHGVTSSIQTQLDAKASQSNVDLKAPLASPTFTGVVTLPSGTVTSTMIADGTIATADIADSAITSAKIADGTIVDADISSSAAIAQSKISGLSTSFSAKADLASPTFTGTVAGITKSMVGLANVDNTSDANKPVSTATQTALDLKAPLASPTFTGTVTLPTGTVTSGMILDGTIVNADISASAAIADTKLATISTSGKVSNSATTATDANTASAIVARDASGNFTANLITVNTTPTASGHAASKAYVDSLAAGINWHDAVKYATSTNISAVYANGTSGVGATLTASANGAIGTIDGQSVSLNDRVLVTAQTDATTNGIYTVTSLGGVSSKWVLTRATDSDNHIAGQVSAGDSVYTLSGTNYANIGFALTSTGTGTNGAIVIGTDNITWTQFTGAASFVAGSGLVRSGNTVDVVSSTLSVTGDSIDLPTVSRSNTTGSATNNLISSITTDTYGRVTAVVTSPASSSTLTIGTGLSGTSYNGTGAVTVAIDSTVATLTGTQTLTNKTLTSPTITLPSAGITFSDSSVQTVAGVPSVTPLDNSTFATGTVNLATGLKDYMVKVGASVTITLQQDSAATYPIGTSIDFWANGAGAQFAAGTGVTIVNTPGLKFRAVGSVATAMKVAANTWLVFGDLSA